MVKNQVNNVENGIYIWKGPTTNMERAGDSNNSIEGNVSLGNYVFIEHGDNAGSGWVLTSSDAIDPKNNTRC